VSAAVIKFSIILLLLQKSLTNWKPVSHSVSFHVIAMAMFDVYGFLLDTRQPGVGVLVWYHLGLLCQANLRYKLVCGERYHSSNNNELFL